MGASFFYQYRKFLVSRQILADMESNFDSRKTKRYEYEQHQNPCLQPIDYFPFQLCE
jgi:hypothetical protein